MLGNTLTSSNGTGVTLTYTVNRANRLTALTSSLADANHPATILQNVHYGAFGATSDSLGNGMIDAIGYTPRGWMQSISATSGGIIRHSFNLTFSPNGNIATANDSVNGNWTYSYDDFNRLLSANATAQAYTYDYDRYGNRWHQNGPHPSSLGFDANNRIVAGSGVTYDAAGNVTTDGTHSYTYDAEGRIWKVDGGSTAQYIYDASGQRIRKTTASNSVDYLYDLAGHSITELSSSGSWNRGEVYAGGRHLATYRNGTTYFIHSDWLSTERARTDKSGAPFETCTSLAFGDWLTCAGSDISPMHFTAKERDSESGLDNFGARFNTSTMGRFMTPDPGNAGTHRVNPQSWNGYAYVQNRPLNLVDPNGLEPTKSQAGTIQGFAQSMNNTPHKVGLTKGSAAAKALRSLGETDNFNPKNTGVFNKSTSRYVYTESGGWIDMVHFVFYAGRAAEYSAQGNANPLGAAVQDGYLQERADSFKASWSAYSYEDLPSDLYGAAFGAYFFDPTSPLTLAQQIEAFLSLFSPTDPTNAPNYADLPDNDSKKPPMARNHTTTPMYVLTQPPEGTVTTQQTITIDCKKYPEACKD